MAALKIPSYLPLIALHPGAKDGFKQWPPSHFIELGNRLTQSLGSSIIVTGAQSEKALVESIASKIEGATAATDLPLLATAALIKRMDLMIANDTGPMHLAFAMRTPTIGLFAHTDPALCGPYFIDAAQTVSRKPTCSPCLKKKCREPFCLLQIGVQEVYDSALKLFENRGSCKTPRFRKIDDFGVPCQSQRAGSCRSDETIPQRVGKEERWQRTPKGQFCGCGKFCNCLDKGKEHAFL